MMDDQELDYGEDIDLGEELPPVAQYDRVPAEQHVQLPKHDAEDADEDAEEERHTAEAFGITPRTVYKVSNAEMLALRHELGAGSDAYDGRAVLLLGVDGMHDHRIEKMFASFRPSDVVRLNDASAVVHFTTRNDVAAMMLNMTKALRRVRSKKRADEEGEVVSEGEEEEEGQLMNERGDDVAVVDDAQRAPREVSKEYVTVDVDVVDVPHGRWRVVTQHVAQRRFLILRYATRQQVEDAHKDRLALRESLLSRKRKVADNGFWSSGERSRPGLNVFDDEGNELEWDYEHDTRFYESDDDKKGESPMKAVQIPKNVKVRGRGAVKASFLYGDDDVDDAATLANDEHQEIKRKRPEAKTGAEYEKDDVLSRSRFAGRLKFPEHS